MSQRRVIESYARDVGFNIDQLNKLVVNYKMAVDSACDLNSVALSSRGDVKEAIRRAKKLGKIIDDLIDTVDFTLCTWKKYMELKAQYIDAKLDLSTIEVEVEEEIRLQG